VDARGGCDLESDCDQSGSPANLLQGTGVRGRCFRCRAYFCCFRDSAHRRSHLAGKTSGEDQSPQTADHVRAGPDRAGLLATVPSRRPRIVGPASAMLGLGHMAFTVPGQSAIAKLAEPARLDASFGWFTASFSAGQLVGPLLAGWLLGHSVVTAGRIDDINGALVIGGWIALLAVPSVLIRFASHSSGDDSVAATRVKVKPDSILTILSQPGVKSNILFSLALLATVDILVAFVPLMAEDHGIAPSIVGVLLALRAAASILSQMLLTIVLRRWSRDQLITASLAGAAIGLAALPFVLDVFWLAALSLIVSGFFLGLGQPLTMTLMAQVVRAESRSTALAIRIWATALDRSYYPLQPGCSPLRSELAGQCGCRLYCWAYLSRRRVETAEHVECSRAPTSPARQPETDGFRPARPTLSGVPSRAS
jgi:MFS family permease